MYSEPIYDKQIFADNLRRLLKERHERQMDLVRLLDVSRSTLSAYCAGAQMPRMDKLELIARHFGVPLSALLEAPDAAAGAADAPRAREDGGSPILAVYDALNDAGQTELLRYGRFLGEQSGYRAAAPKPLQIRHFLVPAAAGTAAPIEGEDFEWIPRPADAPPKADFCLTIAGDSMEPYIRDGQLVYVRRDAELREFDVGVFFVDGDVLCKQWCLDYAGTLHLLSANPLRQSANRCFPRDSGQHVVCFGKVLLPAPIPKPNYT